MSDILQFTVLTSTENTCAIIDSESDNVQWQLRYKMINLAEKLNKELESMFGLSFRIVRPQKKNISKIESLCRISLESETKSTFRYKFIPDVKSRTVWLEAAFWTDNDSITDNYLKLLERICFPKPATNKSLAYKRLYEFEVSEPKEMSQLLLLHLKNLLENVSQ